MTNQRDIETMAKDTGDIALLPEGLPDARASASRLFGLDSAMEVPAYSRPSAHVPALMTPMSSTRRPRWPSWQALPTTGG